MGKFESALLYENIRTDVPHPVHFIYILDRSYSMKKHWLTLEKAYNNAISNRLESQADDLLSVLLFDNRISHVCKQFRLSGGKQFPALPSCSNGSTSYSKALKELHSLAEDQKMKTKLIFMSDG